MVRKVPLAALVCAFAVSGLSATALAGSRAPTASNGELDAMISRHAAAEGVPEDLVRRVIKRESGGNPRVISKGNYGLMQIKLATARGLGYTGNAAGLLDAETNMTWAVKYLSNAYRVAHGNRDLAVHYYAAGYYYAAKNQGMLSKVAGGNASEATPPSEKPQLVASVQTMPEGLMSR